MIKAVGHFKDQRGQRPVLILGLTAENVTRLRGGEEIMFEADNLGLSPMQVVIVYGEDEQYLMDVLKPIVGENTKLRPYLDKPNLS